MNKPSILHVGSLKMSEKKWDYTADIVVVGSGAVAYATATTYGYIAAINATQEPQKEP
jgi:hypothetical protein